MHRPRMSIGESSRGSRPGIRQSERTAYAQRVTVHVTINPHAIPSDWVTQISIAGLDFATLTRIFGDSVSVTWERYLKADKSRQMSQ
jgi:hypothetical protein